MDLQPLSSRAAEAARKRNKKTDLKDCPGCGRPLLKKCFSNHGLCNPCYSNKLVTCGCGMEKHRKLPETDMQIYDVANDKYYLSQGCADKGNKLSRKELNEWKKINNNLFDTE